MKEYKRININTNLASNPFLIFLIWLFLIILPYLILADGIERLLQQSESRIISKAKIQLIDEVNLFRNNLTSSSYINSKLSNLSKNLSYKDYNALELAQEIEKNTKSKVLALFYYNTSNNSSYDFYLSKIVDKDLKMHSRFIMKNLLLHYSSDKAIESGKDRNVAYFEKLLSAAGGINLKPENTTPILSGKTNFGRMLGYFKTFSAHNSNHQQMFLCLFKEENIPLKEIIKFAIEDNNNGKYIKELVSLNNISSNINNYDKLNSLFFKFQYSDKKGLSIFAKASDELLLKLGTQNTYYPLNLEGLLKNEPILKLTIPKSYLEHPMRDIIKRLSFPTLLLILLSSFGLSNIGIYGYTANIKILGRVIICVFAAVVLPFASFFIATFYNQYFEEEYSENEIQTYTRIQTEVINKAIESYIENRELEISKLRNNINGCTLEQIDNTLKNWIASSGASLISYKYKDGEDQEIPASTDPDAYLFKFGKELKNVFDLCIDTFFREVDLSKLEKRKEIDKVYGFIPYQVSPIISNIGKIYPSVSNEPNSLYSLIPIYDYNDKVNKIIGSIVIKFDNQKILKQIQNQTPELFQQKIMGNYIVRNAVIPINSHCDIPKTNKMILTKDFNYKDISLVINQILSDKSQKSWGNDKRINSANYLNKINAIVISSADKITSNKSNNKIELKYICIYIILMIITLSVILSGFIVAPIRKLQNGSEEIANGNYSNKLDWHSGDEFEKLCDGFNEMSNALLQKEMMSSYVSKEVINEVSSKAEVMLQPGGERIPVAVLFCALKGEKELSNYTPEEVTTIISCLIDAADEISSNNNGQIDKLIEDTIMIVFRKINENDNIVLNACKTALAINKRLQKELPDFKINMGIASGDAVSGKIGSNIGKLDFTVIGNPVNLAARLKVQAYKAKNTGILICPNSIRKIHGAGKLKFIERMSIKGRTNRTFPLYELISLR